MDIFDRVVEMKEEMEEIAKKKYIETVDYARIIEMLPEDDLMLYQSLNDFILGKVSEDQLVKTIGGML